MTEEEKPSRTIPSLQFTLEIGDESFHRNVGEDMKLDPDDLDKALIEHPAIYAYYASIGQKANLIAADAKFQYEKAIAEHSKVAREELSGGTKRATDKQIAAIIESQPLVLALKRTMIKKESESRTLWGFLKALEHKKDCLMQLCNNKRKEMEHLGMRVLSPRKTEPPIGATD